MRVCVCARVFEERVRSYPLRLSSAYYYIQKNRTISRGLSLPCSIQGGKDTFKSCRFFPQQSLILQGLVRKMTLRILHPKITQYCMATLSPVPYRVA